MEWGGCEWDEGNWPKCGMHGVTKDDIEGLFYAATFQFKPDLAHSQFEDRWIGIGIAPISERWTLAVFTIRSGPLGPMVRPISVRFMHHKEVRNYASNNNT